MINTQVDVRKEKKRERVLPVEAIGRVILRPIQCSWVGLMKRALLFVNT